MLKIRIPYVLILELFQNKYKKVYAESMVTEKALEKLKSDCKNPMENYMNKEKLLKNKIVITLFYIL